MTVLLSFDIEEFDFPKERDEEISVEDGVKVSKKGAEKILKILEKTNVKATFFVTGNFARLEPDLVKKMIADGHEVGAHGVNHFNPTKKDIAEAKKILEKITGKKVNGWRQPRMQKIDYSELARCGYLYDSSMNPAFIPGRYNNSKISRTPYEIKTKHGKILEIPASVATFMRVPTFWLALHLFPLGLYKRFAKMSLKKTGYFVTYFHPWEFTRELSSFDIVPGYIKRNSGEKLERRLESVIKTLKSSGHEFRTYSEVL
ncbi:polysaccharide deacetylase family protein [Candidatus Saccharibacteria bacterium]|nr:polysaccharide deacetylase family protein [Candidatus Saccharibacteria bacterium]